MIKKPFKVKSSSSEHFERSYLERGMGNSRVIAGGELCAIRYNKAVQNMNKKYLVFFVLSFLLVPIISRAYISPSGTQYDPYYFKEVVDPYQSRNNADSQQRNQNTQKENNLKNTYGLSSYYACFSESESYCGIRADTGNPSVQANCLTFIQYCLERKAMNQSRSNQSFTDNKTQRQSGTLCNGKYWSACPSGNNFVCPQSGNAYCETPKTNDQICQNSYGQDSNWDGTKNNDGKLNCGCKIGYQWSDNRTSCVVATVIDRNKQCQEKYPNSSLIGQYCDCGNGYQWSQDRTQCVAIPIKTNDQICSDKFGQDSNWDGTKNNDGKLNCGCKIGYEWDATQNECVAVSVKSSQQMCAENYGANSIWTGEANDKGGPICDCKAGYQWNQGQSLCVVIPKPKTTPESSVIKKDSKSSERANQQSSSNSSVSDKVKIGNSSSVFLNKDESITTEDVGTTTIERKIPERESVWKRLRNWFQKKLDKQETTNINYTDTSLVDIPTTEILASTTISFIGLYKGAGLVRNCPSFDCKIIKYGAICPSTEVLFKEGDWYRVKFTERGVFDDKVNQSTVCGEDNSRILPESSWSTVEGWMPSQVIPPQVRQKFK